jgi:hypothetical protein
MIEAIKAEGLKHSQAPSVFHTLTDVLGPRLTGGCPLGARPAP